MNSQPAASSPMVVPAPAGRGWHLRLALLRAFAGAFPSFTLNRTRFLALKACGVRAGTGTLFWGLPKLTGHGPITSRLQIGTHCGFNDGCEFDLNGSICIGNHVSVGHEVRFLTTRSEQGVDIAAPITIGDGVWLGARSTISPGVTVGAGSVIGAGVTVTTDVPPNTLLTGAKPISLAKWR